MRLPAASSPCCRALTTKTPSEDAKTPEAAAEGASTEKARYDQENKSKGEHTSQDVLFRFMDLVLGGAFGILLFKVGQFALDWPDACQHVVDCAAKHPWIRERVGLPLSGSMFWSGSVHATHCVVTIPITGHAGTATLEGRCARNHPNDPWTLILLECVFPESPQRVSIMLPEMQRRMRKRPKETPSTSATTASTLTPKTSPTPTPNTTPTPSSTPSPNPAADDKNKERTQS